MNFEVIDNGFQVTVLLLMTLCSFALWLRYHDRRLLTLAFAYVCFAMGTLYFVLYLAITGQVPQVFYVAEISWLASYLFFLSLQILRTENIRIAFLLPAFIGALCAAAGVLIFQIFGPSWLMCILFAVTSGANAYLSVFRALQNKPYRAVDIHMLICLFLQIALYGVSMFMEDFTRFNLYFAVDILLTVSLASMLPLTLREVKNRDVH